MENNRNYLDELLEYFANTSKEQIKKDFEKYKEDGHNGIAVVDYLKLVEDIIPTFPPHNQ
jgi:hypothetical protein